MVGAVVHGCKCGRGWVAVRVRRKTVFPSMRPDRREDAALLAQWLQDMVGQLTSKQAAALAAQVRVGAAGRVEEAGRGRPRAHSAEQEGGALITTCTKAFLARRAQIKATPAPPLLATATNTLGPAAAEAGGEGPSSVLELANGVLQVYQVAFEELKRQVRGRDVALLGLRGPGVRQACTERSVGAALRAQVGSECKERAALLGTLWDHWSSAVELRTNLAAEVWLGAMQVRAFASRWLAALSSADAAARELWGDGGCCRSLTSQAEYTRLMDARDKLSANVAGLNRELAQKERDAAFAEAATAQSSRSLAGKLAAAQAQAEELTSHYKV